MTSFSVNPENAELPLVAIVGRPNVGKSTLLNRVIGRREAIVEARPGVTRDRKEVLAEWQNRPFRLLDTGGWMASGTELDDKVSQQSEQAIADADVIVLVVDGSVGLTDDDTRVAKLLRRLDVPIVLAVNKIDAQAHDNNIWDFMSLGLGEPQPISALHGRLTGDFLDLVCSHLSHFPLPELAADHETPTAAGLGGENEHNDDNGADGQTKLFSVAIVGRPNVGKSTLFNRLIGEERSVVHDQAGTTRDTVDTIVDTDTGPVRFIDTAGMRRQAKVDEDTEYYSVVRALSAVDTADVALLVIDATVGVTHQDQRLAERVDAAGCPIVVLFNKWEMLDAEGRDRIKSEKERKLHFVGDAPVLQISALTGKNVHRLWPALQESISDYRVRVPTRKVNDIIRSAQSAQPAPHGARVLYATQGATDPPTFTLFANKTLHPTYVRYLERSLREGFDLGSTPIKMRVRHRAD